MKIKTSESQVELAAEQLNNKLLRDELRKLIEFELLDSGSNSSDELCYEFRQAVLAYNTPSDTSALDAYVAEKVNKIESCRDWYKRRIDLLQEWQSKMRDPERTIVCDIIANGLTMPEGSRYEIGKSDLSTITKQRDLAVEALKEMLEYAGIIEERCDSIATDKARAVIKESEGK